MNLNIENFGKRSCAFLMDMLFLTIAFFLVSLLNGMFRLMSPFAFVCVCYALTVMYFTVLESGENQATLGKRMLGLMVVRTDSDEPVTFIRAAVRNIFRLLYIPIYCVGYLPVLFTKKHQAIHDMVVHTTVVDVEYEEDGEEESEDE